MTRRPTAFKLDEVILAEERDPAARPDRPQLMPEPDEATDGEIHAPVPQPRSGPHWGRLLAIALGGLASIAIGLAIDQLIGDAFDRAGWLGWLTTALAAVAALAFVAFAIREIFAIVRLARIAAIQRSADQVIADDDRAGALAICQQLAALYGDRPETDRGRRTLSGHMAEIIDGRDLLALAEHELLHGFDETARRTVLTAARRVSLVTAISPRALIDVAFVATVNLRLMRQIAFLYGGRPGTFGFFRLARSVVTHLALTGGMAAGESMVQQIVGHGLAARLSARLGEGLINGMLTARVGLAAIDVCRPLPFIHERRPRLADIVTDLGRSVGAAPDRASKPARDTDD